MKLGEFFVKLGIDADNAGVNRFNQNLKTVAATAIGLKAAFLGAVYGMDRFVSGTIDTYANLQNINEQTGLSIDLLQKWDKAAQLSNLTVKPGQAAAAIKNLKDAITELQLSGGGSGPFNMLGIDPAGLDTFELLEKLRDRISQYSPAVGANLLKQIGLDPALISTLKLSREEFDKLGKNDFLSEKGRAALLQTGRHIRDLQLRMQALKDQVALQLSPVLLKLLNDFFKWLINNKTTIVNVIKTMATMFVWVSKAVSNALQVVTDFVSGLFGIKGGLTSIQTGFLVLFAFLSKRMKIFTMILTILDDIQTWRAGGEAMFGPLYNWINKVLTPLKELINNIKILQDILGGATAGGAAGAAIGSVVPGVGTAAGAVVGGVAGGAYSGSKAAIAELVNSLKMINVKDLLNLNTLFNPGQFAPGANINVTVYASGTAAENAKAITREIQNAQSSIGNGVR